MADIEYRIFFNNTPATREQLDSVEEITVEQEVDMAWEAHIKLSICLDERGKWIGEGNKLTSPFSRVRVEIKVGKADFVPLIDGPTVGFDNQMNFEPGQSSITLSVRDDSVYLNRKEDVEYFEKRFTHEIAAKIFNDFKQEIADADIEKIPPVLVFVEQRGSIAHRGTAIDLLKDLAKCHSEDMHAYVLPGEKPGKSKGCFKSFPTKPDGLPALILLGAERNMKTFNVKEDSQRPSNVMVSTISITNKGVVSSTASFRDRELLGEVSVLEDKKNKTDQATQILSPYRCISENPEKAAKSKAGESSYAFEATGSVLEGCYPGVLQPYRVVAVKIGDTPLSGDYQIIRVTHSLTRSTYSQSFSLRRNAQSERSGNSLADLGRRIF